MGAVAVGQEHLRIVLTEHPAEREVLPVRGPGRIRVHAAADQFTDAGGLEVNDLDIRVVLPGRRQVVVGAIGKVAAIGCPIGMNGPLGGRD